MIKSALQKIFWSALFPSTYGIISRNATLEKSIEYQKYCLCGRKILKLTDPCISLASILIEKLF